MDAPATRCRPGVVEDGPLAADKERWSCLPSLPFCSMCPCMLEIINTPAFARIQAVKIYLRCIQLEVHTYQLQSAVIQKPLHNKR